MSKWARKGHHMFGLVPIWQLRCRKSTCRCGTKHILKATNMWETTLDAESWVFVAGRRNGLCTLPTVSQTCGLYSTFKNDGRHGRLKRIWKNASRVAGAVQETSPSDMLGGQGAVPERGCILENQIFRFAKIIWHDRFSTSWPGLTCSGQAEFFNQMEWNYRETHWYGAVSSALHFPLLRKSVRTALCIWRCQVQTLKKSRRISSFWSCQHFTFWGSLVELPRCGPVSFHFFEGSRWKHGTIVSFQTDGWMDGWVGGRGSRKK